MQPIKKTNLHYTVADLIKSYIEENNLQTGDRLPTERTLAEMLDISRASVREGLRLLEGMGIIDVIVGRGIFIKNFERYAIFLNVTKERESALELLDIKKMIDQHAIITAIQKAGMEDIEKIEEKLIILEKHYHENQTWSDQDWEFHCEIYKCCKNEILYNLITSTIDLMVKQGWNNLVSDSRGSFEASLPLHRELYNSIKSRDKDLGLRTIDSIYEILINEVKH